MVTPSPSQIQQCEKLMNSYNCQAESVDDLWNKLRQGVLVHDKDNESKEYYFWLDDQYRLGVELFARALDIIWGNDERYWAYERDKIPIINKSVEVAKLKDVCWLDIQAKLFDTGILTEGTEYEVFFDIEMSRGGKGWNCIMKFAQDGPFGRENKLEMRVDQLMGAGRIEIPIGKFELPTEIPVDSDTKLGSFKMYEHGGQWKDGLIVRGVIIKPVVYCKCSLSGTPTNVRKLSDVGKNKSK